LIRHPVLYGGKMHWIPGQARNDDTATWAVLIITKQPLMENFDDRTNGAYFLI